MLHLLTLMLLLLSDADATTCPLHPNPLKLDPPIVMAKLGEEVVLNCTSSRDDHNGMYWTDGINKSKTEENEPFVPWTVKLSDYNVTARCIIKLSDTPFCGKDLRIVFTSENPTSVIVQSPAAYDDHVVEGTELELRCVNTLHPVQNMTMTWYKGNTRIRMDHFPKPTADSNSSLLIVNVSRGDDGAEFRCETWLDDSLLPEPLSYNATFHLSVHYAPHPSKFQYDDVHVHEGHNVTLSCDAGGNPAPHFNWTRNGETMMEHTRDLILTQVDASALYTCVAANHVGNSTQDFNVLVEQELTVAPAVPMTTPETMNVCSVMLTPAEVVVRFGDRLSVNCSTLAPEVERIYWVAPGTTSESPSYAVWTVEELQDWSIRPTCSVVQRKGRGCSAEPTITLYKTPDSVLLSRAPKPMVEGVAQEIQCDIINVAPLHKLALKCYWGEDMVASYLFRDPRVTAVNHSMVLNVTPKRGYNGKTFKCNAEMNLGPKGPDPVPMTISAPLIMTVHYAPEMRACPSHYTGVEDDFRLELLPCRPDGNPPPTVQWYYQNKPINGSEPLSRAQAGEYTAHLSNEFSSTNTSINITIEYGPSFTCADHFEVKENEEAWIECEPQGIPLPGVTWFKHGVERRRPLRWTKQDRGNYILSAKNKHGSVNHTFSLDVLYAPEFQERNYSQELIPGGNLTIPCSAEGNPAPEIRWSYTAAENLQETTGGSQRNITITGATSTNAGVYACVATNEVGTVSRSVTLIIRESRGLVRRHSASIIWWLLILCAGALSFIAVVILCKQRRKHGQYSFIPAATEASDIPLTTTSPEDQTQDVC